MENQNINPKIEEPKVEDLKEKDKYERLQDWLNSSTTVTELITLDDINKEGVIVDVEDIDTKYGLRALIKVDLGNGVKGLFLGKTMLRDLINEAKVQHVRDLLEKKVKIGKIKVMVRGKSVEKPCLQIIQ